MRLGELLAAYSRIVLAGVPKAGKTTLADRVVDRPVIHTDDYIEAGWDDSPRIAASKVGAGSWLVEGVRGLAVIREGAVPGLVVWLPVPLVRLTTNQERFAKGRASAFEKWLASGRTLEDVLVVEDINDL
jgi:hypothetical protein